MFEIINPLQNSKLDQLQSKKICLIELSTSHTEIIEPFLNLLLPHKVELLIPREGFKKLKSNLSFSKTYIVEQEKNALNEAKKLLSQNQYDLIVLNSAQGKKIRNLVLSRLFDNTPIIGFHHNPQNLIKSFTQKIIKIKVKKYILLADFNKDYLVREGYQENLLEVFYPLQQVHTKDLHVNCNKKNKPKNIHFKDQVIFLEQDLDQHKHQFQHQNLQQHNLDGQDQKKIKICIPGVLEQDRRDYLGLIHYISKNKSYFSNIEFVLLGNSLTHDGPKIQNEINNQNLGNHFKLYQSYVLDEELFYQLQNCDYVMPLIHPENKYFDVYHKTKISGAYNLAYSFEKPLLMHKSFETLREFKINTLFYDFENLKTQVKVKLHCDQSFYAKFEINKQRDRVLKFLFN